MEATTEAIEQAVARAGDNSAHCVEPSPYAQATAARFRKGMWVTVVGPATNLPWAMRDIRQWYVVERAFVNVFGMALVEVVGPRKFTLYYPANGAGRATRAAP